MRSDFRNLRSWSLILNSGLLVSVVTREVLSPDFSPGLLTPIVASSTRKMSYPPSLILETTSAICSLSASDSLIASPSSFISCFSCWSTSPPEDDVGRLPALPYLDAVTVYPVRNTHRHDRHCTPERC